MAQRLDDYAAAKQHSRAVAVCIDRCAPLCTNVHNAVGAHCTCSKDNNSNQPLYALPQTSTVDAIVGTGQHAGLPLPDRDGGRSASTSGSAAGRSVPGEERRPRIRLRRPGPQDWLVLLDEASLLPSLSQVCAADVRCNWLTL